MGRRRREKAKPKKEPAKSGDAAEAGEAAESVEAGGGLGAAEIATLRGYFTFVHYFAQFLYSGSC